MKTKLLILGLSLIATASLSAQFLAPTNPPPSVSLAWTASTSPGVTNNFIYYGSASGQYTNKVLAGNTGSFVVTNVLRGTRYFFVATAVANGLESVFSNEVNYTVPLPPQPPSLTLTVQSKTGLDDGSMWADTDMKWIVVPESAEQVFRLNIVQNEAKQVNTLLRLNDKPAPPPIPGQ